MDKKVKTDITKFVNLYYKDSNSFDDLRGKILKKIEYSEDEFDEISLYIKKRYDEYVPKLKYSSRKKIINEKTNELKALVEREYVYVNGKRKIDFDKDNNIVLLTKNNAFIIENEIRKDENYIQFAEMVYKYYALSNINIEEDKDALKAIIRMIDYENSTQGFRMFRDEFNNMIEGIWKNRLDFFKKLKNGKEQLPDDIVKWTGENGTRIKSLSSKICQHLNQLMLDGNGDGYYKNDRYIRHALLFYLDKYGIEHKDYKSSSKLKTKDYSEIFVLLERLKAKSEGLSRKELDHIIWYSYKSYKADL